MKTQPPVPIPIPAQAVQAVQGQGSFEEDTMKAPTPNELGLELDLEE